ncbi:MAG: 16S rRNA (guanine(527)-N(7))-methyltransferase RsmG [Erysipelotrichales bacterium]|nr:16S rRNA (guanine(527)-N(7))-methyltransferase RsmG [Erysipelotrichales bacterium]
MTKEELKQKLEEKGIPADEEVISKLEMYLSMISDTNKVMNLTAITDPEAIREKHFYDSLLLYPYVKDAAALIDVGTGAGFPGIPLKIVCPDLKVTLLDATKKKCDFIQRVIKELGLKKAEVVCGRAEELAHKGMRAEIVTGRAVSNLRMLSELCLPLCKMKGRFIAMKGPMGNEELREAENALQVLGGKLLETVKEELPSGDTRVNLIFEKYKPTPKGYPRRFAEIKKKPL